MTDPEMRALAGWAPIRAAWRDRDFLVFWRHLGEAHFTDPFFYETIAKLALHPFNQLFGQCTRADALSGLPVGLKPTGFIFHMARCGSTLCAQALAASRRNIVISEALPIRNALRAPLHGPASAEQVERWLGGLVNAFAQKRFPEEERFFVKFMAADVLDAPLIRRVFPDTPWLFLSRDPIEILASQQKMGGADTIPGELPSERLGLSADAVAAMSAREYQCHFLAALARAALAQWGDGRGMILNYRDLPDALFDVIPRHFGFELDKVEVAAMRMAIGRDAKRPADAFTPDGEAKRSIGRAWRDTADAIAGPEIARLDRAAAR
jgi:hypothetical protein